MYFTEGQLAGPPGKSWGVEEIFRSLWAPGGEWNRVEEEMW